MQLSQIDDGFRAVFKRFEGQADAQVGGIKDQIDKASRSFEERRRLLCRVLWGLQITGWASVVVGERERLLPRQAPNAGLVNLLCKLRKKHGTPGSTSSCRKRDPLVDR